MPFRWYGLAESVIRSTYGSSRGFTIGESVFSGCRRLFFQGVYPHVDGLAGRHAMPAMIEPTGAETAPIGEADAAEYARVRADLEARYPDVSIFWPAPVTQ
jgi:hypothetical protein